MATDVVAHVAYGVQVERPDSVEYWEFAELKPADDRITPANMGIYDDNDFFLVVADTWKTVGPGEPMPVEPYMATMEPYMSWDAALVATAEELKVPMLTRPAWMFIADET